MFIDDLKGQIKISSETDLMKRLQSAREGLYGAFTMYHDLNGPSLWLHINGEYCYLHYFSSEHEHPGYQANGMAPESCPDSVQFIQTNAKEADGFEMPKSAILPLPSGVLAACEFLKNPRLPNSINWFEL